MRTALLLPAAVVIAGCGGDPGPVSSAEDAGVHRLELSEVVQRPPEAMTVLADYRPDEASWVVTGAESALVTRDALQFLELRGAGVMTTSVPVDVEPDAVGQVAVTVRAKRTFVVRLQLGPPNEGEMTDGKYVRPQADPVTLYFDVAGLPWNEDTGRTLSVHIHPPGGPLDFTSEESAVGLIAVALIHRPLSRWLPTADEPLDFAALGEEARQALGVVRGAPVETAFDAESWHALFFSHGVPPASQGAGEHRLRVTLTDASGREQSEVFPTGPTWGSSRLSLAGLSGEVTARFEPELAAGGDALVALGEVRLERRAKAGTAPTVLLISSDTHRADHLGSAESGVAVKTPTLDRLARRGVLFTDAVSTANLTHPSHTALLTGYSPRDTGVIDNLDVLSDEPQTVAELFRDAGWVTFASVSAGSLDHARSGLGQGFDRMSGPGIGIRDSSRTIAEVLAWLDDSEGLPVFVWLHLFDAHTPYREHRAYTDLYYPKARDPRDPNLPELAPWQRAHGIRGMRDVDYGLALYRAEITYLDAQLAKLINHSRMKRAITAFTSDHGESLTAHGVWFGHEKLYPQTLRVPLILSWPGGPRGERVELPVRQMDVARTLLDLAGIESGFPGRNLVDDAEATGPRFALASGGISASVITGDWFFVLHLVKNQPMNPSMPPIVAHAVELYDLSVDPDCEVELAEQRPGEVRKLRRLLIDWLLDARPSGWRSQQDYAGAAAMEELAELGYAAELRGSNDNDWFDRDCECEQCRRWE